MKKIHFLIFFLLLIIFSGGCNSLIGSTYRDYIYDDSMWASDGKIIYRYVVDHYKRMNQLSLDHQLIERNINYSKIDEYGTAEAYLTNEAVVLENWEDYKISLSPNENYIVVFGKRSTDSLVVDSNVDKDVITYSVGDNQIIEEKNHFLFYGDNVEWSPNEDAIIALDNLNNHLWIIDISGEGKTKIVTESCEFMAWGTGGKIVFVYDSNGDSRFASINSDGSGRESLPVGEGVSYPYISRIDNNNIYGIRNGALVKMNISNASSPVYTTMLSSFEGTDPKLSSDETGVVFQRDDGIWFVDIDGTGLKRLKRSYTYVDD